MTYKEAIANGWENADMTFTRGYVSRKADIDEAECHEAKGKRKGQLYVLVPCNISTQYCYRLYLIKEEK